VSRRSGWSLVEMLVVVAIIVALAGLLTPSLAGARRRARLVTCAVAMHDIHQALMGYAAVSDLHLPPFRFSDCANASLPASGHWGGVSQVWDPVRVGTFSTSDDVLTTVNLFSLVEYGSLSPGRLICPGSPGELRGSGTSMFGYTSKFSTYCMRFPYSADVFRSSPGLIGSEDDLHWVYRATAGGQMARPLGAQDKPTMGHTYQRVPQLRIDRAYRIADSVAGGVPWGDGIYDVSPDAMFSDAFWWEDRRDEAARCENLRAYRIRAAWSHGSSFNVATGDGAVFTVTDDPEHRPIAANTHAPDAAPDERGPCDATAAERVWAFFDTNLGK